MEKISRTISRHNSFSLKLAFVARANRCYNNRDIEIVFSLGTNNFSISRDSLVTASRGNILRLFPFLLRSFRTDSWKRTCPPGSLDKNIFAKIQSRRNFRQWLRSKSNICAIARSNLVFPRVCIFFVAYSWPRRKRRSAECVSLVTDRSTDRPTDRSIEFFSISSFSSRSALPSSSGDEITSGAVAKVSLE